MTVFPEGTTYPDDEVRTFLAGGFLAAMKHGSEILPIGLAYREPEAIYFEMSLGAHGRRVLSAPAMHVAVRVGAPIASVGSTSKRLARTSQDAVQALVHAARRTL